MNPFNRLRLKLLFGKKTMEAADEMWDAVNRGISFEVPLSLNTQDPAIRALYVLQAMHPEVNVFMRQSRGFVVSRHEKGSHGISDEVRNALRVGGQLPDQREAGADIIKLIQSNENFLREQRLDPNQMEREAKEAEMKKHAIEVNTAPAPTDPLKPIDPSLDEPEVTPLMRQRERMKKMRESLIVNADGRTMMVEDKTEELKP